jgi:hypothetical protein
MASLPQQTSNCLASHKGTPTERAIVLLASAGVLAPMLHISVGGLVEGFR